MSVCRFLFFFLFADFFPDFFCLQILRDFSVCRFLGGFVLFADFGFLFPDFFRFFLFADFGGMFAIFLAFFSVCRSKPKMARVLI